MKRIDSTGTELDKLTAKEKQVLLYTGRGYTAKEIALKMDMGRKTVETYKHRGAIKLAIAMHNYRRMAYSYALSCDRKRV